MENKIHRRAISAAPASRATRRGQSGKRREGSLAGSTAPTSKDEEPEELAQPPKDVPGHSSWRSSAYVYRVNDGVSHCASILQQVCEERGWKEFGSDEEAIVSSLSSSSGRDDWNLWWRSSTMKSSKVRALSPWQLTNHIPKATAFCRKDCLARYLRRMCQIFGPIFDFSPTSFNLPLEYTRLCSEHSRRTRILQHGDPATSDEPNLPFDNKERGWVEGKKGGPSPIWICKPVGKSQGKGILVFDRVAELAYDGSSVVQEYIVRPYLIGGYKWDLRIYAAILSVHPLLIYAYREGLTRFATNKYNLTSLYDNFAHLTNVSLNKHNPAYKQNKDQIGSGCKWSLGRLRRFFKDNGVLDWPLWQRIMSILVLTIIGEAHTLTSLDVGTNNCFEFLGFDILVDHNLRPTLLEVNTNPSLGNDCIVDELVKCPMLHQLLSLLGLPTRQEMDEPSKREETLGIEKDQGAPLSTCDTDTHTHTDSESRKTKLLPNVIDNNPPLGTCQYGDWIRIFPFDSQTKQLHMSVLDVKVVIARMQNYLRIVDRIASKQKKDDPLNDALAKHYGHLSTVPWHPIIPNKSKEGNADNNNGDTTSNDENPQQLPT